MKRKKWREKFRTTYLESLMENYRDVADAYSISDTGKDYFVVTHHKKHGTYEVVFSYDKPLTKSIETIVGGDWEVAMQYKMTVHEEEYTYVELVSENKVITIEVKNKKIYVSIVYDKETDTSKDIRDTVQRVKQLIAPNIPFSGNSVMNLYTIKELSELVEWDPKHLRKEIERLDLSMRGYVCLSREGYQTVGDIVWETKDTIQSIPQMGSLTFADVIEKVDALGIPWGLKKSFPF